MDFNKKNVKVRRVILDGMKDCLFPHVIGMKFAYKMWASLVTLHQSFNEKRKMALRKNLRNTKITKTNILTSYMTKISQLKDELFDVVEAILEDQLIMIVLDGFP